jgi:DNA-binding XRE family transcriptional regulator
MDAKKILAIRNSLKLTQDEFGKLIGVSKNTFSAEFGNPNKNKGFPFFFK